MPTRPWRGDKRGSERSAFKASDKHDKIKNSPYNFAFFFFNF
jgi:hypothetical protein